MDEYYFFTAMGLGFIIIAVFFYFFLVILNRARSVRHQGVNIAPFIAQALIFFFFALIRLFLNLNEFDSFIFSKENPIFYALAVIFGFAFFISFIFVTETILKRTYYLQTIFCTVISISGGIIFNTIDQLRFFTSITTPIFALILVIDYLIILVLKTKSNVRRKMELALIALVIGFIFYALDTSVGQTFFLIPKEIISIIARVGILIVGLIIGYIFVSFESFIELDWSKKLKHLFIIGRNGVNLFDFSFIHAENEPDPDIITASLSGIKELMASIIRSKDFVRVVDHQDLKLIFEYGQYATLALITTENLHIYHQKLANLRKLFEDFFQEILPKWDGKTDVFLPTKQLVREVFELKDESKGGALLSISSSIRRFTIISLLLLVIPVIAGFSIYFLTTISWPQLLNANWLLLTLSISAGTLAVFPLIYLKFVLLHKINTLHFKITTLTYRILSLLILCAVSTVLGFLIYLLFCQVFWASLLWIIGVVDYFLIMLIGISLIERLERTQES